MSRKLKSRQLGIRGLMLDPARLTERHDFYFKLLPQIAEWGFNTLWWHFSDDEGFALKLKSHPELASPYAFTKTEMKRFIHAAHKVGIDVVPELETLGHMLFITSLPQYAHLLNGNPFGHNAVCPSHPDTLRLLEEIIKEVADLFDSTYFHAGLDEAVFGDCKRCRRKGTGKPSWWVFSEHVKAIHQIVTACGKRMIMWADSIEKDPRLLQVLPRNIVMAHWHYGQVFADKIIPSIEAGYEIVCVPSITGDIIQPNAAAFQNVDDMVALATRLSNRGNLGAVACWWESFRGLRDSYFLAVSYTGQTMLTGQSSDKLAFVKTFLLDYFGLKDARAAKAFWQIHELTLSIVDLKALLYNNVADIYQALNLAMTENFDCRAQKIAKCVLSLRTAQKKVKRHKPEYNATLLSAQILATCFQNGQKLTKVFRVYSEAATYLTMHKPKNNVFKLLKQAASILVEIHKTIESTAKAASKEWDRTRYPKDNKKDGSSPLLRQRNLRALLAPLLSCHQYHKNLLRKFQKSISAYHCGGPFPEEF